MFKYIGVILARGGSKRLPDKNILKLNGKPLIQYSIEYAINCEKVSHVFVSTDDYKIANIATKNKAGVIKRNKQLSNDTSKSSDALKHAVEEIESQGIEFDNVVLLQPTSPFRPKALLNQCIDKFESSGRNSLITVSPLKHKFGEVKEEHFIPVNYSFEQRSQDINNLYFENGLIYITKKEVVKQGKIFTEDLFPFIVDSIHAQLDIDTREDLDYAEFLIRNNKGIG